LSLFREEALDHKRRKLHGDVILAPLRGLIRKSWRFRTNLSRPLSEQAFLA